MEINPEDLLKYARKNGRNEGEVSSYIKSMSLLPDFEYSRFYDNYPGYEDKIGQGDTLVDMLVVKLPGCQKTLAKCIVISNTCDIDIDNERKYQANLMYAPLIKMSSYKDALNKIETNNGVKKYNNRNIEYQLTQIRNQDISQIFYLPQGQGIEEESIVFLDSICSISNNEISRDNLSEVRLASLSMYGWHVFLVKLNHFFTKMSSGTVDMRLKNTPTV